MRYAPKLNPPRCSLGGNAHAYEFTHTSGADTPNQRDKAKFFEDIVSIQVQYSNSLAHIFAHGFE